MLKLETAPLYQRFEFCHTDLFRLLLLNLIKETLEILFVLILITEFIVRCVVESAHQLTEFVLGDAIGEPVHGIGLHQSDQRLQESMIRCLIIGVTHAILYPYLLTKEVLYEDCHTEFRCPAHDRHIIIGPKVEEKRAEDVLVVDSIHEQRVVISVCFTSVVLLLSLPLLLILYRL